MKTAWQLGDVGSTGYGFEPGTIYSDSDQNSNTDLGSTSSDSEVEDDGDPENTLGNSDGVFALSVVQCQG